MNQLDNVNDRYPVLISRAGAALSYGLLSGRQSVQAGTALDAIDSLARVSLESIL
jgi:hypothetical protein